MSGWPSMSSFRPCRTVAWSSASRTRSLSGMGVLGIDRDSQENCRALAERRFDLQRAANERRALLHAGQTEAGRRPTLRSIEADPVILDHQDRRVVAVLENGVDA